MIFYCKSMTKMHSLMYKCINKIKNTNIYKVWVLPRFCTSGKVLHNLSSKRTSPSIKYCHNLKKQNDILLLLT